MKRVVSGAFAVSLFIACSVAMAGPYEDGQAAYEKRDFATALRAWTEGAAQGDAKSQNGLGALYIGGQGVTRNTRQGIRLITQSADQGWAKAQANLASFYLEGLQDLSPDYEKAMRYGLAGAQQNHPLAQFVVGTLYLEGMGVAQDDRRGLEWMKKAAEQGDALAQATLAHLYFQGTGTSQDYLEGVRYARLAAQQNEANGQGLLGKAYALGEGVKQDLLRAYMWVNLALPALGGTGSRIETDISRLRDLLAKELHGAELASAQAMGRQCRESKFENCGIDSKGGPKDPDASPDGKPRMVSSGTGFYVSAQGHIVTNNHVIDTCKEMRSPLLGVLKVVATDKTSDLAILESGKPQTNFVKLRGGRGVRLGESIVAIGYPLSSYLGSDVKVTTGTVSALSGLRNDRNRIQISAPIQPGNSGGPVVGENGSLVGVAVAGLDSIAVAQQTGSLAQNVNFAVSLGTLQSFLNTSTVPYVIADRPASMSAADIAAEATRYTIFLECWK